MLTKGKDLHANLHVHGRLVSRCTQRLHHLLSYGLAECDSAVVQGLMQRGALPDMQLPLNAADEALAHAQQPPIPLMSFCRPAGMVDILIPNTIEGDVFPERTHADGEEDHGHSRDAQMQPSMTNRGVQSGQGDTRKPMAVWRGTVVRECCFSHLLITFCWLTSALV